jgi:hypothetical protein
MTEDEIRAALHRMVDDDGEEHQAFVAGSLSDAQRQVVAEALRVLGQTRVDFDEAMDAYYIDLDEAFKALLRKHGTLKEQLRHLHKEQIYAFGPDGDRATVEAMRQQLESAQQTIQSRDGLLSQIVRLKPIIERNGEKVCFFGCGYGMLAGVTDESRRYWHRSSCPWRQAYEALWPGQYGQRAGSLERGSQEWGGEPPPS